MNTKEHLLTCLSEECSEVIKEVSKALRFGLEDINPVTKVKNKDAIAQELNDLMAVVKMIVVDHEMLDSTIVVSDELATAKEEKVLKYLKYAKSVGTLKDES